MNNDRRDYGNQNQSRNSGPGLNRINDPPKACAMPADYVKAAEETIYIVYSSSYAKITTSKIRNILTIVNDIYNKEYSRMDRKDLLADSMAAIQLLRIRLVYESGREPSVKDFIVKAKLIEYLLDIGSSREKFLAYSRYMEALVAYHRYFGGKD